MNTFKKAGKEEPLEKVSKPKAKGSSFSLLSILNGSFLSKDLVLSQVPFLVFLGFIAIVYIANTYYAEKSIRQINKINNELKELRSEYITSASDLMQVSKQSEVAKSAKALGIMESITPPSKLIIKKSE